MPLLILCCTKRMEQTDDTIVTRTKHLRLGVVHDDVFDRRYQAHRFGSPSCAQGKHEPQFTTIFMVNNQCRPHLPPTQTSFEETLSGHIPVGNHSRCASHFVCSAAAPFQWFAHVISFVFCRANIASPDASPPLWEHTIGLSR